MSARLLIPLCCVFFTFGCSTNTHSQRLLKYGWCGAVTSSSAIIKLKASEPGKARIIVQENNQSSPVFSEYNQISLDSFLIAGFYIDSLKPITKYFYALELNGKVDSVFGSFNTFSEEPFSFSFVVSSCCQNSNHPVYNVMREKAPLFYINDGDDKNYRTIEVNKQSGRITVNAAVLQKLMNKRKPVLIYTTSLPKDPSKAALVRVRRILLCTIEWN